MNELRTNRRKTSTTKQVQAKAWEWLGYLGVQATNEESLRSYPKAKAQSWHPMHVMAAQRLGQPTAKGGGLVESRTPRPPCPDPPKFSNPSFSNLRFWGKVLAPKVPKSCFFLALCVYPQNAQNFVENSKWVKSAKNFDPDLTPGSGPG